MRILLTIHVNRQPEDKLDDLMNIPMTLAEGLSEMLANKNLHTIKGFDVALDTEHTQADNKIKGVPYEVLRHLKKVHKNN
jgi:hypothetical protein